MRSTVLKARRWLPRTAALALVTAPVFGVAMSASAVPPATNQPTLTIQASPSGVGVPTYISATADLENGINTPDANLTFRLFSPADSTCSGTPLYTATGETSGNGGYSPSSVYINAAGTYRWTASFAGDTSNLPVATSCNAANSTTVVTKSTPTIVDIASGSVPLGGQISDTATLTGTSIPGGTIAFALYGPNDPTCSSPPVTTLLSDVGSHTTYQSAPFIPTTPGVYRWISTYSGDDNNGTATTACADDAASVIVQQAVSTASIALTDDQLAYGAEQDETVTATVTTSATGPTPTGSVTIQDGSLKVCTIVLASTTAGTGTGSCEFTKAQLRPNSYLLAVSYAGDTYAAGTLSAPTALRVTKQASAVTLHLAHAGVKLGKEGKEHFAVVAASPPGGQPARGKVAIRVGRKTLCTAQLHGDGKGSCSLSSRQLPAGHYTVTAHYLGTTTSATSISAPKKLHITG